MRQMNPSSPSTGTPSMRIFDAGSPHLHPRFAVLSWATITFKPNGVEKALTGGHCLLGADQTRMVASSA